MTSKERELVRELLDLQWTRAFDDARDRSSGSIIENRFKVICIELGLVKHVEGSK